MNWFNVRRHKNPTVLHVTHYKAGSQWIYSLLKKIAPKRVVTPLTSAEHITGSPLRPGFIYPTGYITRQQFDAIQLPVALRVFIVNRDLRDTLISLYFSHYYSHPDSFSAVKSSRDMLASMDKRQGILWLLEHRLKNSARIQRSWLNAPFPVFRYEELIEDEYGTFERLVEACNIEVPRHRLHKYIESLSFKHVSGRQPGVEDFRSHQRKGIAGDWKNYFDDEIKIRFKELYGDLIIATGYERDNNW